MFSFKIYYFKKKEVNKLENEKKDHLSVIRKLSDHPNGKSLSLGLNDSASPVFQEDYDKIDCSLETIYLDDNPKQPNFSIESDTSKDVQQSEIESVENENAQHEGVKFIDFDDNILEIYDEDTLEMTYLNLDSESSSDCGR